MESAIFLPLPQHYESVFKTRVRYEQPCDAGKFDPEKSFTLKQLVSLEKSETQQGSWYTGFQRNNACVDLLKTTPESEGA